MTSDTPDLGRVKHAPIFLVPYAAHDGPYAGNTDCLFLSLGWAQYDPRSASLKTLRYTGSKWSRQSEELPLHRVADLAILLVRALRHMAGPKLDGLQLPPGTLENQPEEMLIQPGATSVTDGEAFKRQLADERVRRRLRQLRDELNELHDANRL